MRAVQLPAALLAITFTVTACDNASTSPDSQSAASAATPSTNIQSPVVARSVDLTGHWRLANAEVGERRVTIPRGLSDGLVVRGNRAAFVLAWCYAVSYKTLVNGTAASFSPGATANVDFATDCGLPPDPSLLSVDAYLKALEAVDHAERTSDTLVLTGHRVVLTYESR